MQINSVRVVSSSSGSGQAELYQVHYLSHIFTVLCEATAWMSYSRCPLSPTTGSRGALWVREERGGERYLLHFGLNKASDETNFTCIFMKEYPKFDKLRDLVYVH